LPSKSFNVQSFSVSGSRSLNCGVRKLTATLVDSDLAHPKPPTARSRRRGEGAAWRRWRGRWGDEEAGREGGGDDEMLHQ